MESGNFTLAAFLDKEEALTNVGSIQNVLYDSDISSILSEWIDSILESRINNLSLGESSIRMETARRVLSPLLWLLMINEMLVSFDE